MNAIRFLIAVTVFGALGACSAGPSDDQIKNDFTELRGPKRAIHVREIARGDGWSDGMEGVVRYDVCRRDTNARVGCERRSEISATSGEQTALGI